MRYAIQLILTGNDSVEISVEADTIELAMGHIGNLMHDGQVNMFHRSARGYTPDQERYRFPVDMKRVMYAKFLMFDKAPWNK